MLATVRTSPAGTAFDPVLADGIRLVGEPGGPGRYTSMSEIEVWGAA